MSVVIILITASLTVALGFLGAFIWSVKSGQYDDDYTPSVRMLFDDHTPIESPKPEHTKPAAAISRARDGAACMSSFLRLKRTGQKERAATARPGAQKINNHTKK